MVTEKSKLSFETKKAYCARVRRSNYLPNLSLERFSMKMSLEN